jgi:hypothetical protein
LMIPAFIKQKYREWFFVSLIVTAVSAVLLHMNMHFSVSLL